VSIDGLLLGHRGCDKYACQRQHLLEDKFRHVDSESWEWVLKTATLAQSIFEFANDCHNANR
jgi:hypothetical protein